MKMVRYKPISNGLERVRIPTMSGIASVGYAVRMYIPAIVLTLSIVAQVCTVKAQAQSIQTKQVAAGNGITYALKANGTVWKIAPGAPTQIPIAANLVSVVASRGENTSLALALDSNGQVWTVSVGETSVIVAENVIDIAVGISDIAYAVKSDGTAVAWGRGYGTTPVTLTGLNDIISVTAGAKPLFLRSNGTIVKQDDQSGSFETVSGISDAVGVAAGGYFNPFYLVLRSNGMILAWGSNFWGQLGNGNRNDSSTPNSVTGLTNVVKLAAGQEHAIALTSNGEVWTWGRNDYGQLGLGDVMIRLVPTKITNLSGIVDIDASTGFENLDHSVALKSDGSVWGWGNDWAGNLGYRASTLDQWNNPITTLLSDVIELERLNSEVTALKSDGTIWVWGNNGSYYNGYWSTRFNGIPVRLNNLEGVISVSVNGDPEFENNPPHGLALKGDGSVWGWGSNNYYRLGRVTNPPDLNTPTQIEGLTSVKAISTGKEHSIAVKSDGTVWTWGYGVKVTPAPPHYLPPYVPINQVSQLSNAVAVTAGGNGYSIVLTSDGNVWAWTGSSGTPVQIENLEDITTIDCYKNSSLAVALKSDGSVWTFQGVGPASMVPDLTDVADVSAYNYALKSDGTVWSWGINGVVQLPGIEGAVELSHGASLKEDGTVYTWQGQSDYNTGNLGCLGEGSAAMQITPVPFLGFNASHAPPQVAISDPLDGATMPMGQSQTITATVTQGDGTPGTVYFYHHGRLLGQANSFPYTFEFIPPTWGDFKFTSIVVDSNGAYSARSEAVTISVPYDSEGANGDGLPDWWEIRHFGNLAQTPTSDFDNDGLSNAWEFALLSNPTVSDSDGDGIPDNEDARPGDPNVGLLNVIITFPTSGTVVP